MGDTARLTRLHDLLEQLYRDTDRLDARELRRQAAAAELSPALRRVVDALPDGEYDRAGAYETLAGIQRDEGIWRDETRLPMADLSRAMATSGTDGQYDDPYGNEAGPAEAFGDRREPSGEGEPDPDTTEGRRLRPSPEGRSGPH